MLPEDKQARKNIPLVRGLLDYFPDALCAVAELSRIGNDQHNPGEPLHWAKEKSTDEADALMRHLIDRGKVDTDGVRHATKVAWRALALLQREIENEKPTTTFSGVDLAHELTRGLLPPRDGTACHSDFHVRFVWCNTCKRNVSDDSTAPGQMHYHRSETHVPSREDREAAYAAYMVAFHR